MKKIRVEISPGELFDKITILELKRQNIPHPDKLKNINHELSQLKKVRDRFIAPGSKLNSLISELKKCNSLLWEKMKEMGNLESKSDFGENFLKLAKEVFQKNNVRYEIKRKINNLLESGLTEEKDYRA